MFQFPPFAAMHLCIQCMLTGHDARRVSPFGYTDQRSLPTPRSISQVAASFIASWCLGIHRVLLLP